MLISTGIVQANVEIGDNKEILPKKNPTTGRVNTIAIKDVNSIFQSQRKERFTRDRFLVDTSCSSDNREESVIIPHVEAKDRRNDMLPAR